MGAPAEELRRDLKLELERQRSRPSGYAPVPEGFKLQKSDEVRVLGNRELVQKLCESGFDSVGPSDHYETTGGGWSEEKAHYLNQDGVVTGSDWLSDGVRIRFPDGHWWSYHPQCLLVKLASISQARRRAIEGGSPAAVERSPKASARPAAVALGFLAAGPVGAAAAYVVDRDVQRGKAKLDQAAGADHDYRASSGCRCDLAGEWVPARHDEWYTSLPGSHSDRAKSPETKVVFDADGNSESKVGGVRCTAKVTKIAPGQYVSSGRLRGSLAVLGSATDAHMSLLEDGVLEVRVPSAGILEYWQRADGRGREILRKARTAARAEEAGPGRQHRSLTLGFSHFGPETKSLYTWHWGLGVGHDFYEVKGGMAVHGPDGAVARSSTSPAACPYGNYETGREKFHGYLPLGATTRKRDDEIRAFIERWVQQHPVYKPQGPNCQTFVEDFYSFLTLGGRFPYPKFQDRLGSGTEGAGGPESDSKAVWNKPEHNPNAKVEVSARPAAVALGFFMGGPVGAVAAYAADKHIRRRAMRKAMHLEA